MNRCRHRGAQPSLGEVAEQQRRLVVFSDCHHIAGPHRVAGRARRGRRQRRQMAQRQTDRRPQPGQVRRIRVADPQPNHFVAEQLVRGPREGFEDLVQRLAARDRPPNNRQP